MLPKSYTSPSELTSPGSIFRKLYSCPAHTQRVTGPIGRWAHTRPFTRLHLSDSTWLDVVSDDAYVLVAVRARVFVPEADHVAELVHHDAKLIAVLPYGDGLGAGASPPHVGATPAGGDTVQGHILQHLKNNWLFPAHIKEKEKGVCKLKLLDYRSFSHNRFGYEVMKQYYAKSTKSIPVSTGFKGLSYVDDGGMVPFLNLIY